MVARTSLRSRSILIRLAVASLFIITAGLVPSSFAQSDRDLHAYMDAIQRVQAQHDLSALERFVSTAPNGSLRTGALEWLAWQEWRSGALTKASHWSDELLAANSQNAVGLAVLSSRIPPVSTSAPQQSWADDPLLVAQRALRNVDTLTQPYGMPNATFRQMKDDLSATLDAAVGDAYFQRKDYTAAQPYLRAYLAISPDDSRRIYSLAMCDLYGSKGDQAEGFRLLARLVNLTQGTSAGQQYASFARAKYKESGGTDQDWDRYLQATSTRGSVQLATTAPARVSPSTGPAAAVATPAAATPGSASAAAAKTPAAQPTTMGRTKTAPPKPATRKSAPSEPATTARVERKPEPREDDSDTAETASDYDVPETSGTVNVPYPTRVPTATGAPMSLGILIETSKTAPASRRAVINNLSDMVRHLRDDDEAFLVSFSNNVVFEEDLTSDPKSIEKALDKIKPQSGSALLDAIAFASGHLQRIGKNSRKILLVISDGQDRSAQYSQSEALTNISSSGVSIYCIGMGSNSQNDEARLKALARRTGGEAVFIDGSRQFRTATREVASDIGIRLY